MGALKRMSKKCQECPNKDKCDHKRMELCAYFEDKPMIESNTVDNIQPNLMPLMRETIQISIGGVLSNVYKDEIEREINKAFREPFMLKNGL